MYNKLLLIYNICEISRQYNCDNYISILKRLTNQSIFNECKLIISGCKITENTKQRLINEFQNIVSYNFIEDAIPVNVTFNHSVLQSISKFGEFDGYMYIDSGSYFRSFDALDLIYNRLKENTGILSILPNIDHGLNLWFDESKIQNLFIDGEFIIPLGKSVNGICYIFTKKMQQFYNKLIPDIFAAYCTESVYSFLCAAINCHWMVINTVPLYHQNCMDYSSSCTDPIKWRNDGNKDWEHPFIINSILDRINKGIQWGMGYEEYAKIVMHDSSKFNKNGYAICPELKNYIKENLFLKKSEFDYNKINYGWIN